MALLEPASIKAVRRTLIKSRPEELVDADDGVNQEKDGQDNIGLDTQFHQSSLIEPKS